MNELKTQLLESLAALAVEYGKEGWDGHGASAIMPAAVEQSRQFIDLLPDDLPMPELAGDPDGSVSMDWIYSKERMLTLSLDGTDRIAYAWINRSADPAGGRGVADFHGTVPEYLIQIIKKLDPKP